MEYPLGKRKQNSDIKILPQTRRRRNKNSSGSTIREGCESEE